MDESVVIRLLLSDGTPIDADPFTPLQLKTINLYIKRMSDWMSDYN